LQQLLLLLILLLLLLPLLILLPLLLLSPLLLLLMYVTELTHQIPNPFTSHTAVVSELPSLTGPAAADNTGPAAADGGGAGAGSSWLAVMERCYI
jgi:hypothetical protein